MTLFRKVYSAEVTGRSGPAIKLRSQSEQNPCHSWFVTGYTHPADVQILMSEMPSVASCTCGPRLLNWFVTLLTDL